MFDWYEDDGVWKCEIAATTVGEVRFADSGDVEGSLGALARFTLGALAPDVAQPPPSPAGYYWTATLTRGVWCPWTRADSLDDAKRAVESSLKS